MRIRLLFIAILLATSSIYAQSIKGRLLGTNNQPVEEAIVTLLRSDSSFVAHSISGADGSFTFSDTIRPYILRINHTSYEMLELSSEKNQLGDILLREQNQMLAEAVVKAKRPLVKMQAGQLSFNVQELLTRRPAHSAFDLLRSVPGLKVSETGGVSILGGLGKTHILIDGNIRQYPGGVEEYLKNLDPRRIDHIDLAYIAPPEFGVKGASINIILKRNVLDDFSGLLQAMYAYQKKHSFAERMAIQYNKGAWNFDLGYTLLHRHALSQHTSKAQHNVQGVLYPINTAWQTEYKSPLSHTLSLGLKRKASSGRSLGLYYAAELNPKGESTTTSSNTLLGSTTLARTSSNHTHSLRSEYDDKHWRLGVEYTFGKSQGDYSYLSSPIPLADYTQAQRTQRLHGYTQFSRVLGRSWSMSTGLRYTYSHVNSQHQRQEELVTNEHIGRAYLTTAKALMGGRLNLSTSLIVEGYFSGKDKQIDLIPQLSANYTLNPKHAFSFSYQSYHDFPSYYARLGYEQRFDGYNVYRGNPNLRVGRVDNLSLVYVLAQKYNIYLTQRWSKHARFTQAYQSYDALEAIHQEHNVDYGSSTTLGVNAPFSFGKIASLTLSTTLSYAQEKSQDWYGISFDERSLVPTAQANIELYFSQKPRLVGLIDFFWKGKDNQVVWRMHPNWGLDLGLMATLMKDRLKLSLYANDLFETALPVFYTRVGTQNYEQDNRYNLRSITFSASYRFSTYRETSSHRPNNSRMGLPTL